MNPCKFYVGIDESNVGSKDRITFYCAFGTVEKNYSHKKIRSLKNIENNDPNTFYILTHFSEDNLWQINIHKNHKKRGPLLYNLPYIYLILKATEIAKERKSEIEKIIIDGAIRPQITNICKKLSLPKPEFIIKGDKNNQIIKASHELAYLLLKNYKNTKKPKSNEIPIEWIEKYKTYL